MLSRVADALYWIGRYLERAENTTRLLLVTEDLGTELRGFDEQLAHAGWADLTAIFPHAPVEPPAARGADAVARAYLAGFFANPANAYSILYSMRKARENARAIREALTVEVFVAVNDAFRALEAYARRPIADVPAFRDALSATHRDLHGIVGAIEHTLTRDQGWSFLKLGEALERAFRVALALSVKLRSLGKPPADLPPALFYAQWRGLLRALSSLENYRRVWGARMEPALVVRFLVFDPDAPRALRFGTTAIKQHLDHISGASDVTPPARIVGRLAARLQYEDDGALADPVTVIDEIATDIARVHDAIELAYFGS
jgi:uncharacterized alpha-E superfamily protein